MARARKNGVYTPHLLLIDEINRKIYMEYIENSITAKELIWDMPSYSDPGNRVRHKVLVIQELAQQMASSIAKMHNADIVHGDLTTSNFLVKARYE